MKPINRSKPYLFEVYSRNLEIVKKHQFLRLEPDVDDIFVCPLCFQFFSREEVVLEDAKDSLVSLEHVPPEALGGKVRTLTCSSCNRWSGHELDSHLVHKLDLLDFIQGLPGASIDTRITLNDTIKLTATAKYSLDRHLEIITEEGRSDPKELKKISSIRPTEPLTLNLSTRGKRGRIHKPRRAEASLLRSAYLWAFSVFGYGFLINPALSFIRSQINDPAQEILPNWGISQRDDYPDESLGVNIVISPKELQSFMIVFDVSTQLRTLRYSVLLPGPTAPGIEIYKFLQSVSNNTEVVPITYKPIQDNNGFLTDSNLSFVSHEIWEQWRLSDQSM